jgi:predicted AlkP superfamily pyrophosphatase or phosphodiesterase
MRKLVLIVIDGLTPAALEQGIERGLAPTLARFAEAGRLERAVSVFPSLTPVCLATIATGAGPGIHGIPHLVWFDREKGRVVEYGSSFAAARRSGALRWWRDTIYSMNAKHLGPGAVTLFEALEDNDLRAAAINVTCFRGRERHLPELLPAITPSVLGPSRFFYYGLFESRDAGASPTAVFRRSSGSVDDYAEAAGRWLVTRDDFDFLFYYLSDFDYVSHALGPQGTEAALARADGSVATIVEAAGGIDAFLDRYAVLLCSDHGQTPVREGVRLEQSLAGLSLAGRRAYRGSQVALTASNRAAMVYRLPGCPLESAELAERLEADRSVEVVCYRDGAEAVARRAGEELRFARTSEGWRTSGDEGLLDQPRALERLWSALASPNAGDVLISAAPGVEFADLGGRHHAGGGSHGSLERGDSEVPMLAVGIEHLPATIEEIAPAVLSYFGITPPVYPEILSLAA